LILVKDRYWPVPTDFSVLTSPAAIKWDADFLLDLGYFVAAIVFVAAIEACFAPVWRTVGREHRSTV
jgi:hypothetical protein